MTQDSEAARLVLVSPTDRLKDTTMITYRLRALDGTLHGLFLDHDTARQQGKHGEHIVELHPNGRKTRKFEWLVYKPVAA